LFIKKRGYLGFAGVNIRLFAGIGGGDGEKNYAYLVDYHIILS